MADRKNLTAEGVITLLRQLPVRYIDFDSIEGDFIDHDDIIDLIAKIEEATRG